MPKLILLRHGQSQWNLENRFTGWVDVDLTDAGREEGRAAGRMMRDEGLKIEVVHTSLLKRAIFTMQLALEEMERIWVPVHKTWRLNERHYGALQGLDKLETVEKHGEEKVKLWRRSFDVPPPMIPDDDPGHPRFDERYEDLKITECPRGESLKMTIDRFMPYWHNVLSTDLMDHEVVLIVAHGNSLRALIKYLENISDQDIVELNVPTGIPKLYELSPELEVISSRYLGDPEAAARAAELVKNQSQKK